MYGRGYNTVRFGPPITPDVIKYLMIANVAVLVLQVLAQKNLPGYPATAGGITYGNFDVVTWWFAAWPRRFWTEGPIWQPFTYMFLHADLMHIAFNMLALWMFGSPLAAVWGERRFLRFYLTCGVGAGFIIVLWPLIPALLGFGAPSSFYFPTLGASGAVFGVLLAYSLTWPDRTIMLLFPPMPVKAIYFIPFILGLELLFGASNVSSIGHLGGVLVGWVVFRRNADLPILPTTAQLKYRIRRWRMRRNLRAVRMEDERQRRNDDWRVH